MLFLALPTTPSVTLPKSLTLPTDRVLQWQTGGCQFHQFIFRKHGSLLLMFLQTLSLLLLLFMTNTAAELEDLRSPHGFYCGFQDLRFNFKRIKFSVCFTGVTARTYADRLLSSEAKSRHTKTMPRPEQGVTLSHSS